MRRQEKSDEGWSFVYGSGVNYSGCIGCRVGKKIKKGKWREKVMEEEKGLKYPCRQCDQREAVVSKTSGKPTHWMCRECFGEKFRAAFAKKREEKKQSETEAAAKEIVEKIRLGAEAYPYPASEDVGIPDIAGCKYRNRSVFLGFDVSPELEKWIAGRAKNQFRSFEGQVLWELKVACESCSRKEQEEVKVCRA